IPAISQKMLIQQLRQMENDGMVRRIVHHQVPPKVEYALTDWGQALCPALDALLKWAALREERWPKGPTHASRKASLHRSGLEGKEVGDAQSRRSPSASSSTREAIAEKSQLRSAIKKKSAVTWPR